MYVYGKNTIIGLINSKTNIEKIFLSEEFNDKKIISLIIEKHLDYIKVSKNKLNSLSANNNHQGIVAKVFEYQYQSLDQVINNTTNKANALIIILDGLEDPQNFGSIIRTGEALNIDGIIIPKNRSVKVTPSVARVSTGAMNNVDIVQVTNLNQTIKELKEHGYWIVGSDMNGDKSYDELKYDFKVALVIGSEGKGISQQVLKNCDYLIKIPMYGQVSSLNAAISSAIIMYQINSNRLK
ncbi:MAG: 23S rRNA (guanosine(2251)-2'-O)-methyltransferase RlmB [Bacilli bacterium]|jgi:23S rRNA (guanosine2251-2'-O)-methyltransferase|nr:23S rRNA (guanosine(2251)-2'-O)-methyltransferase RlmB [Bacilli bacterium]